MKGKPEDKVRHDSPPIGKYEPNYDYVKDGKGKNTVDFGRSPPRDTSKSISPDRDKSKLGPGFYDSNYEYVE